MRVGRCNVPFRCVGWHLLVSIWTSSWLSTRLAWRFAQSTYRRADIIQQLLRRRRRRQRRWRRFFLWRRGRQATHSVLHPRSLRPAGGTAAGWHADPTASGISRRPLDRDVRRPDGRTCGWVGGRRTDKAATKRRDIETRRLRVEAARSAGMSGARVAMRRRAANPLRNRRLGYFGRNVATGTARRTNREPSEAAATGRRDRLSGRPADGG